MTSDFPTSGDVQTVVKTGAIYARDLTERIVATFLVAFLGVAIAAGSLVKGVIGRAVGPKNSASTAPGV